MSYDNYSQYGGNPYSEAEEGRNPQGHEMNSYSRDDDYGNSSNYVGTAVPSHVPNILTQADFLERVNFAKEQIRQLTAAIQSIATLHQRALNSTDSSLSQQLEATVTDTQLKNTQIRDSIKYLEADTLKTQDPAQRGFKSRQVILLKNQFDAELKSYQQEELAYRQRYRDQIARQYRIVNPEASEDEVRQASDMEWGNEGVFQTALKSNRTGQASSVLGAVRARHNELQRIEATLTDLAAMFADMAQLVEAQEDVVVQTEENAQKTVDHVDAANEQITKATVSARNRRRWKWYCLWISILIIIIVVVVVVVVVEVNKK